jgi:hypothetical protein
VKLVLPVLLLCLTGCVTRPIPVHPDARIARENATLLEQRDALIEHMDQLQRELMSLRLREEYLTHQLLIADARRLF